MIYTLQNHSSGTFYFVVTTEEILKIRLEFRTGDLILQCLLLSVDITVIKLT